MLTASLNAQTFEMVKDIHPTGGSNPNYFTELNGKLYFQANNGTDGMELWVTDGTESGTQMVKNISLSGGSHPRYFKERSEEHTSELQSRPHLVCRLLLEKKKKRTNK